MIIGEVGPVEVELIYSLIFIAAGTFGTSCYDIPLEDLIGYNLNGV